jgi:hypothetical protein
MTVSLQLPSGLRRHQYSVEWNLRRTSREELTVRVRLLGQDIFCGGKSILEVGTARRFDGAPNRLISRWCETRTGWF